MKHLKAILMWVVIPVFLLSSCGTQRVVPFSGRKYRVHEHKYSDSVMLQIVKPAYYAEIQKKGGDSKNVKETKRIQKIAIDLIGAATKYLHNNGYEKELKFYEWDVHLVPAPGEVNACCMPGGKILIFEEILPIAYDDAGMAAIMGHEIGHALAHHTAENWTKQDNKTLWQKLGALALGITGVATGGDTETVTQLVNNTVELSNGIMEFVEAKYSRNQEYEADRIGLMLMAMAGYDPREAPKVWERMTKLDGDSQMRILSSHPSNKNRMNKMRKKWMPEAMRYYEKSQYINDPFLNPFSPFSIWFMGTDLNGSSESGSNNNYGQASTYRVSATKLNVRSAPSINASQIIGSLRKGEIIKVVEISKGWAKIQYNGKTGYVKTDYISPTK